MTDTAYKQHCKAHFSQETGVRYAFADYSEIAGRDWLVPVVRFIPGGTIVSTAEHVQASAKLGSPEAHGDADGGGDFAVPREHVSVDRAAAARAVYEAIRVFHGFPTNLGAGASSLPFEAAALLRSFFSTVGITLLNVFLHSFVSITIDMGTELGLANFAAVNFSKSLPRWLGDASMVLDDGGEHEGFSLPCVVHACSVCCWLAPYFCECSVHPTLILH